MTLRNIATVVRDAMTDAWVDAIDDGGGAGHWLGGTDSGGSTYGTELFDCVFSAEAFDDSGSAGGNSAGVATANSITDESAATAGTAAIMRITTSTPTTLYEGDIGGTSSGDDLELNTTTISTDDTVSITSATITFPSSG